MAVTPLDYVQMRLLAEASLGQSGPLNSFVVGENGAVEFVPPDQAPPPEGVLLPTGNETRRSALRYLTMQVQVDGVPQLAALDLMRYNADAVFWSDAAVKKFVQPYVTSCGGYGASEALAALRLAWNGVAADARVFAVVHVTWVEPGTPTPIEPLWVAYVQTTGANAGEVGALPISRFNKEFAPALQPEPVQLEPVAYERPLLSADASFLPTYPGLRGVAEWSVSLTGGPVYFLFDPVTNTYSPPSATLPPVVGSQIVIPMHNRTAPAQPLIPSGVWLQPPGDGAPVNLAGAADAAFWSTGAIEQFMLPYYASVDGFAGLADLLRISAAWNDGVPGGGGGLPVPPVGGDAEINLEGEQQVYAVVHLPQSAWVTLEESLASTEIAMVHRVAGLGRTAVTPAREFLRTTRKRMG